MSGGTEQFEPKTAEEMGVRLFEDPPGDFDPVRAADAELARYGYPRRPDQATQPQAYQRWKSVVTRPTTRIAPLFGQPPVFPRPPGGGTDPGGSGPGEQPGQQDYSGNWAGRVAGIGPADTQYPIQTIYGTWTVPEVLQPTWPPDASKYALASWVGLDGRPDPTATPQLIQAGTSVGVIDGSWVHGAFFEWFPALPVGIANFEFAQGNVIQCTIDVIGRDAEGFIDEVNVTWANLTTGKSTTGGQGRPKTWPDTFTGWPYTVPAPGYYADWILEQPAASTDLVLARFASVYYDNCWAYTNRPEGDLDAGQGDLISMLDSYGGVTAQTVSPDAALTDLAFRVDYITPGAVL
jgi:Peptidase A4 family